MTRLLSVAVAVLPLFALVVGFATNKGDVAHKVAAMSAPTQHVQIAQQ